MGFINNQFRKEAKIKDSLKSNKEEIRTDAIRAIKVLGKIKDQELIRLLILSLKDNDGEVVLNTRKVIEDVLPNWQDTDFAKQLVPDFIEALNYSGSGYTVFGAVYALGKIKDNRAVKPLLRLLMNSSGDICTKAILALGQIKDTTAVDSLIEVLNITDKNRPRSINPTYNAAAAWAAGEMEDVRVIKPLINVLDAEDDFIRWCAENSLAKIGDLAFDQLADALLHNSSYKIRFGIAYVLGLINDINAVEPLIAALEDDNDIVRFKADRSLKKIIWNLGMNDKYIDTDENNDWKGWWTRNKQTFKKTNNEKDIKAHIKEQFFGD